MPMTKEQKADIKERVARGEKALKDAAFEITQAKRAGLDVIEEEKEFKRVKTLLLGIKRVYT